MAGNPPQPHRPRLELLHSDQHHGTRLADGGEAQLVPAGPEARFDAAEMDVLARRSCGQAAYGGRAIADVEPDAGAVDELDKLVSEHSGPDRGDRYPTHREVFQPRSHPALSLSTRGTGSRTQPPAHLTPVSPERHRIGEADPRR